MNTTEILMAEHRVIEQVLNCLEKCVDECNQTGKLNHADAGEMIHFFREFADGCHHEKEETQLFPLLVEKGYGNGTGPVDVMLDEHETGRNFLNSMANALTGASRGEVEPIASFTKSAKNYISLMRQHIKKEDNVLFPAASKALDETEQSQLKTAFDKLENEHIGAGVHEQFIALANRLAKQYRVPLANVEACCSHGC